MSASSIVAIKSILSSQEFEFAKFMIINILAYFFGKLLAHLHFEYYSKPRILKKHSETVTALIAKRNQSIDELLALTASFQYDLDLAKEHYNQLSPQLQANIDEFQQSLNDVRSKVLQDIIGRDNTDNLSGK